MSRINNYEKFINEMYFGTGSGFELGKKLAQTEQIAKKLSTKLDKEKEYTFDEIAKAITDHTDSAALHSKDVQAVIDELKKHPYDFKVKEEEKK